MSDFIKLARERYSVRSFSQRTIEPEIMNQVLEAGRVAPTACNNQPQRIKVITARDDLAKLDKCTSCRFGAPTVLLICYDEKLAWERQFDGASSGEVDASIVTAHMMLAAHDLGLGTCWVMYFDPAKVTKLFALPNGIVPVAMLPIGYPDEAEAPSKQHKDRLPLGEMLLS